MNYDRRYAQEWNDISLLTRKLTGFKCCFPGCHHKAVAAHHALYRDKGGVIAGQELPGIHTFPLCQTHHDEQENPDCAHHWKNWYSGVEGGARLDARQRVHYYKLLIQGWDEKTQHHKRSA